MYVAHNGWNCTRSVREKNIPNIIDCHLKKGYPILIIFGRNISGTTCHQMAVFNTLPHPMSVSALRGENRTKHELK